MPNDRRTHAVPDRPSRWEIRVEGHLDDRWADRFEGLTLDRRPDGHTLLRGPIEDQAALHGLLKRLRDLGASIVSVARADPPPNTE